MSIDYIDVRLWSFNLHGCPYLIIFMQMSVKEKTGYWQKRALQNLPAMRVAKNAGLFPKKEEWRNVVGHELVAAEAVDVLAELVELPISKKEFLYQAALLHDVGKRKQRALINEKGESGAKEVFHWQADFLRQNGYSEKVIQLTETVGHTSLIKLVKDPKSEILELKDEIDLASMIMHYVDSISMGSNIVSVDKRIDVLEKRQPPYPEVGKGGEIFGGRTYYQIQRIVGHLIEEKLAIILGIENPRAIPGLIRAKIEERIEQEKIAQFCIEAAKAAFTIHQELGEKGKEERGTNRFGEMVLLGDWECEEAVLGILRKHELNIRVISEEHGEIIIGKGKPKYLAVLDGIDGSYQYKAGESADRRYGTMFAIFDNNNPKYKDAYVSFIMEYPTGKLYFAQRDKGVFLIEDEKEKSIKTSGIVDLNPDVRIFVDEGYDYNKSTFSSKFQDFTPKCTFASSRYYADLVSGNADVVCECTRKGNLELAVAYLLVREANGAIITVNGESLGDQKYLEYGQENNEHKGIISGATLKLVNAVRNLIKES